MNFRKIAYQATIVMLTAGLNGAASAASTSESGGLPDPDFGKLDVNRDGYVSRDESRRIRGFDKAFAEADENRDGRLDADEFAKAQSRHALLRAGQYVDDSVITAKVKAALLKDAQMGALAVSVETHKGTVLLSGFVENASLARRAAEIAAGVEGVVTVKNSLVVKS